MVMFYSISTEKAVVIESNLKIAKIKHKNHLK